MKKRYYIFALGVVSALLSMTVWLAGTTVHTSYQMAQLETEEKQYMAQQQYLREQLADSESLEPVLAYAEQTGMVPAQIAGTIEVSVPVANVSLAR